MKKGELLYNEKRMQGAGSIGPAPEDRSCPISVMTKSLPFRSVLPPPWPWRRLDALASSQSHSPGQLHARAGL